MVKCLTAQGSGIGNGLDKEWNQWANTAAGGGGGFQPKWKYPNNQNQNAPEWRKNNNNNNWRNNKNSGLQPEPGVHPDDWGRVRTGDVNSDPSWTSRGNKPSSPSSPDSWGNDRQNRKRERENRKQEEKRRRLQLENPDQQQRYDQTTWNNPNPMDTGRDYSLMSPEETASVSLSRKYGYAIMALSVVVLAVLMVRWLLLFVRVRT